MANQEYTLPESCQDTPPMKDWIEEEGDAETAEVCRPCVLPVVTTWYIETLDENGLPERARQLEQFSGQETLTPLQLAEELDNIKSQVDPNLRNRFRELDCSIQVNAAAISSDLGENNG
jgi:hypothetical protein